MISQLTIARNLNLGMLVDYDTGLVPMLFGWRPKCFDIKFAIFVDDDGELMLILSGVAALGSEVVSGG